MTFSSSTKEERSARGIGLGSAAALVAGNMLGAGVFTTSGFALADLGSRAPVLIAWAVGGGIALCGALAYADLAARLPGSGGEYLFLSRAVHPFAGFLAGWVSLLAGFTAPIAVAAHGLEAYLEASLGVDGIAAGTGAVAIVVCGLAHGVARGSGLRLQNGAVGLKCVAILAFLVFGLFAWPEGAVDIAPAAAEGGDGIGVASLPAFAVTLVWISFAYSGWNAAVYVGGELSEPERTLPRALVIATLGVTFLYVGLNAVFLWSAPVPMLAGRAEVGAIAAEALGGAWARAGLSSIVALALFTSISAMVMVGPRVYAQMADDGLFPAGLRPKGATPRGAIALQVVLALAAYLLAGLRDLLLYSGFLLGLSAAATVACRFLPSIVARSPARPVPGMPWAPVIFVATTLGSAGFMIWREPLQAAVGLGTLAVGAVVYGVLPGRGGR